MRIFFFLIYVFSFSFASAKKRFQFHRAPLTTVVASASDLLGVNYKIVGSLCATMTISVPDEPTSEEIRLAFYSALNSHSISVVPRREELWIRSALTSCGSGQPKICENGSAFFGKTQVFRFRQIDGHTALQIFRNRLSKNGSAQMIRGTNSIVVSDEIQNVARVQLLSVELDSTVEF